MRTFFKFQADVLVTEPNTPGDDEPYTEQMGNCGEKGERIYFTPDFIAGKKLKEHGPQGMDKNEILCYISNFIVS